MTVKRKNNWRIFFALIIFGCGFLIFSSGRASASTFDSSWTSPVQSYPVSMLWGSITWTEIPALDATVTVDVRAGNSLTPDGTWTGWTAVTNGSSLAGFNGQKNMQYRVNFVGNGLEVPGVSDVSISTYSGVLVSSIYDTRNYGDQVTAVGWTRDVTGIGTAVMQVRTSPDKNAWSAWCGADDGTNGCSGARWFADYTGGETTDAEIRTNNNDRYIQYRIFLVGDNGTNSAVVHSVDIAYDRALYENIWTSPVKDISQVGEFHMLTWNATLPAETAVTADVRAGNTATPDGTWTAYTTGITSGQDISLLFPSYRYIQYRINMSSYDPDNVASVSDVTINYSYIPLGTFPIISSPYNTESPANLLAEVRWGETTPPNTNVKLQIRTAPDNGGVPDWVNGSGWCGPTSCALTTADGDYGSDFYETTPAGETANALQKTGDNDQWIQYIAWIETATASDTPILSDVTLRYVVNASPELDTAYDTNGLSVTQIGDNLDPDWGKVRITYRVRDVDTGDGTSTPGYVTPSFSYDNGSGFISIPDTSLSATATSNKSVDTVTYTEYTALWDARADLPDIYNATLPVRVTINDNEAANNTAIATDTIALDTKVPVLGTYPLLVDASLTPASITLSATDDSALEMKVGLTPDLSLSSYEPYAGSTLLALETNPDTVYVQYRDQYNNETVISSVTSTETPALMIIQDVSNALNSDWKLFTSWRIVAEPFYGFANYKLYASGDNVTFSLVTTINSRTTNYYIDEAVSFDTLRYYKIKMTDNAGNVSWMSTTLQGKANGTQDAGEGGGGAETTPPTISSVTHSAISTTEATITWETDELSTSTVGFSEMPSTFTDEIGVEGYMDNISGTGIHKVILSGLAPDTTYYYRILSTDPTSNQAIANNGGVGYSFTTNPGPAISGTALSGASNTQATITWNTDISADSTIYYAESVSGGALVSPLETGTGTLVTSHSVLLSTLTQGTTYFFSVKSQAGSDIALDTNGGAFYQFTTTTDNTDPVISTLGASVIAFDRAAITWVTDEQATSQIRYSTNSGGPYTVTTETVTYGQNHFVVLPSLAPNTTYYFKAYSTDLSGNDTLSPQNSFKTLQDPSYQHGPLSSITSMSATLVTDTNAVISLTTDQPALCTIEYGTASGNYTAIPVTETLENKHHSITLSSLLFSTLYYYRATCIDNLDTVVMSDEANFTTKALQVNSGSEGGDITPPLISSVNVSNVTGENATVAWTTDELANGYVRFGITTDYGNMNGDDLVNSTIDTYSTNHSVLLKNLIPSTKYYFVVLSSDARGNLTPSSESSFTTTSPSTISSLNIVSNKIGEAILAWKTSTPMSSIIEYGLTENYGDKQENTTQTKEHIATVSKLQSNQFYHFRVKGKDKANNLFASSDYTFSPRSLPTMSKTGSNVLSETEVEVTFNTSVPTDALVTYTNTEDNTDTGSQGKPDLAVSHTLTLKNLKAGSTYEATIIAKDAFRNEVKETLKTFTTKQDTTPPEIDQLKTDMALAQDGKVQAIVSWYTDEPATTSITFKEGSNGEERTIDMDTDPSTSHVVVLTAFKIGSVYFLKAKSVDKTGNETISGEKMIITPKQTENVVQMIISNFNEMFGWAKL